SDGNALSVSSPGQISINSINQTLRRRVAVVTAPTSGGGSSTSSATSAAVPGQLPFNEPIDPHDDPYRADPPSGAATPQPMSPVGPVAYKRYIVELTNRS